jgi:hypothetical protein
VSRGVWGPVRGPGSAALAVAALRLAPLRQGHAPAKFASAGWGILIVANGEG